ncbi:MAG: glycine--tRNA ligase [Vigna little leaf phytoplasma]|nr:glycine--tRNA ligase [Vigna little leaf phytoplasma]
MIDIHAKKSLKEIISFSKQYGFIFPGSEIYGGLANSFDYGPLGSLLKQNIKKAWIKKFIQENEDNILLDTSILLNSQVWKASGHLTYFIDLLAENKTNNKRYRVDQLIKEHNSQVDVSRLTLQQMTQYLVDYQLLGTRNWSSVQEFNLLFKTHQGVVIDQNKPLYLRPETCQGIFINFKNILNSTRKKIPFGVGQIGKSFRNEITPGNFIFRTCEFEQMELEFFCHPTKYQKWFSYWKEYSYNFLLQIGLDSYNLKLKDYKKSELSHYSNATTDILFHFSWGWEELWGISSRSDFDLKMHQKYSQQDLQYFDALSKEKYFPYVIEPSLGVERFFLAILTNALKEEKLSNGSIRTVLKLHPFLSPYKVAIFPLVKKEHQKKAKALYHTLLPYFEICYDEQHSIGKRYRKQDLIGTPFCCTIDEQTLGDDTVTIRNRDTLRQERIAIKDIKTYLENKIFF